VGSPRIQATLTPSYEVICELMRQIIAGFLTVVHEGKRTDSAAFDLVDRREEDMFQREASFNLDRAFATYQGVYLTSFFLTPSVQGFEQFHVAVDGCTRDITHMQVSLRAPHP